MVFRKKNETKLMVGTEYFPISDTSGFELKEWMKDVPYQYKPNKCQEWEYCCVIQ